MQLETYISDLLYRYDCVVVPELGAFLTKQVSAHVDDSVHTFYPPKKIVAFNELLQTNDGLLANYISEVEKIPYLVAVTKIAKKVKSIKSYLVQGEIIALQHIGDLKLNAEGNIRFESLQNINFLTDAFGLSQFTSVDVIRVDNKEMVTTIEENAPIEITPKRRHIRPYLKYAAIGILAIAVSGFVGSQVYLNQINTQNQLAQEEANEQLDAKVQEATFVIENPLPAAILQVERQAGNYHIIAGAFRVEANSDKKVMQLRAQGYKARKIGVNRYGLHEVVYSSHTDRLEALKSLRDIKRTHNSAAWLLVKRLD